MSFKLRTCIALKKNLHIDLTIKDVVFDVVQAILMLVVNIQKIIPRFKHLRPEEPLLLA